MCTFITITFSKKIQICKQFPALGFLIQEVCIVCFCLFFLAIKTMQIHYRKKPFNEDMQNTPIVLSLNQTKTMFLIPRHTTLIPVCVYLLLHVVILRCTHTACTAI